MSRYFILFKDSTVTDLLLTKRGVWMVYRVCIKNQFKPPKLKLATVATNLPPDTALCCMTCVMMMYSLH